MPVNYEQLRKQMKEAGRTLKLRHDAFSRAADRFESRLHAESGTTDLKERIESVIGSKADVRCALPREEAIDSTHPLPPMPPVKIRLLACDGSQITPSRHDEISFGLINTAIVEYISRSGERPVITTHTALLDFDDQPSEDMVGIRRDAAEKQALADAAEACDRRILSFALCDGPLELFSKAPEVKEYEQYRREYLRALACLTELKVPAVGYIDRPHSDPVIQMLALLDNNSNKDEKPGADDSMIFSRLLEPGERSAVFGLHSKPNRELPDDQQICFFYLNIGGPGHPYISRVETPAWAAEGATLDLLHAVLMEQCEIPGGHPYPFVLHRAHECAVISFAEKEEIKGLLLREMAVNGLPIPEKSNKQITKELGKISY